MYRLRVWNERGSSVHVHSDNDGITFVTDSPDKVLNLIDNLVRYGCHSYSFFVEHVETEKDNDF